MRRTALLLLTGAAVAVVVLCVGAASPEPAREPAEIEQLQKEVAALRQRVDSLEKLLIEELRVPAPGTRHVPPSWREFEFNGATFYIVPVDTMHEPAGAAQRLTPRDPAPVAPKPAGSR